VANNTVNGGAQLKLGVGAVDQVTKKRGQEATINLDSKGTLDIQSSGGSVSLSPSKVTTVQAIPSLLTIYSDVNAVKALQTQNFNWVRKISSTITYDQPNFGGKWKRIGFNAAQTSPNLDRTYPNAGGLPGHYNSGYEAFEIVRSGVYAMRVQLWFKTDHLNKQPLMDSWNFSGSMYLRFVVQDQNNYQYELSANQKLHSEYVSIDEVTLQDISYLSAGWKLWVELSVNFPALKDGQVVMPDGGNKAYPSSFKLALIS
jgi:hypothetical protein